MFSVDSAIFESWMYQGKENGDGNGIHFVHTHTKTEGIGSLDSFVQSFVGSFRPL